jgi:hypothetical protein
MLLMYVWAMLSRYQNAAAASREYAERFQKDTVLGQLLIKYSGKIDRTGFKILENNKNIQSSISVNTNILLRRFRLKFLRIMYSTSCYKERLNFENTLYNCVVNYIANLLQPCELILSELTLHMKKKNIRLISD